MAILPGNVRYSEFGEEIRRYLIYTTVDKVQYTLYIDIILHTIGWYVIITT